MKKFGLMIGLFALMTQAAQAHAEYFIDIRPKDAEEIELILDTLDETVVANASQNPPPIVMMLHGKEAKRFLRSNYAENRELIDLAAKLSSFGRLDVRICETWLKNNRHPETELFPFIGTVPFGDDELERLEEEGGYSELSLGL